MQCNNEQVRRLLRDMTGVVYLGVLCTNLSSLDGVSARAKGGGDLKRSADLGSGVGCERSSINTILSSKTLRRDLESDRLVG